MISLTKQPQVLCSYQFFSGAKLTMESTWQQGLDLLSKRNGDSVDEVEDDS